MTPAIISIDQMLFVQCLQCTKYLSESSRSLHLQKQAINNRLDSLAVPHGNAEGTAIVGVIPCKDVMCAGILKDHWTCAELLPPPPTIQWTPDLCRVVKFWRAGLEAWGRIYLAVAKLTTHLQGAAAAVRCNPLHVGLYSVD
jgi:hypothetical protein